MSHKTTNTKAICAVAAAMAFLYWCFGGFFDRPIEDESKPLMTPAATGGAEKLGNSPAARPVRLQRRLLPSVDDGQCVIRLATPAGFQFGDAEAFAVQETIVADEPIVGADPLGAIDLRTSDAIPKIVAVRARGAAIKLVEPICPGAQQIRLRPEAMVSGVVRDRGTRQPVGAVTVLVSLGAVRLETVTTIDGTFTLSELPAGVHRLTANTFDKWGRAGEPVLLAEGAHETGVEILLDTAHMLRGEIRPLSREGGGHEAQIQLKSPQLPGGSAVTTTVGGEFEFGPLPEGEYKLVTSGDAAKCDASLLRHETTLTVGGRDQRILIDIGERYQFKVLGVDGEGKPVAHLPLSVNQETVLEDGLIQNIHRPVATNADGEATVCDVTRGGLAIEAQGRKYTANIPEDAKIRVVADDKKMSRIRGHLLTEDGEPVTLREVLIVPITAKGEAQLSLSNDSGDFVFDHLAAGLYRLEVRPSLREPGSTTAGLGLARPPEVTEEVELRLEEDIEADLVLASTDNDRITGVVLDARGAALAGAMVSFAVDQGGCWASWEVGEGSTVSDVDGRFVINGVRSSVPMRIHAMHAAHGRGSLGNTYGGAENVQVRVSDLAALRVGASTIGKFARHSAYCSASIVSDDGCNLAGGYVPSDGSPIVFDDLPAVGVTVTLKCMGQDDTIRAAAILEAHKVTNLDLLPL